MKKIKFIVALLAVVVCAGVVSSCGDDDEPSITKNQLTKMGETADLLYAGIFKGSWGYSIFITNDASVDLTKEIGTESNPAPDDFVTIDIPFSKLGKRVKKVKDVTDDDDYYFGASLNGSFKWFDGAALVMFNGYVNYDDEMLTVDITAENDYTKVAEKNLKKLAKESVKVTFKGKPVIASEYLYEG
ncbi:MAG: hypothetical protein IK120_09595 [Muribaculaceae bacterium]|nr:hypothetical protein [Muribaculaceae bacterium]MBR5745262.1 hypothetical protein [Muribaculaceae bacterium]